LVSFLLCRLLGHRRARSTVSFIAFALSSLLLMPVPAADAAAGAEPNAYVTANLNLRAGPDTDYPAVVIIPAQAYVTIFACIQDLSWCDIAYGENRGWVSAPYIQPFYSGRYMTVQEYAPLVGLPTAPFDVRLYWNSYYSGQPFYSEIDQWAAPRPAFQTSSFYEPLGAYGDWVEVGDQYAWVPRGVDPNWRPYTRGHWSNTDQYGWFWASDEPFGWATYHYGRWGFSHAVGWFWVPGTVWAPAWVAWRGSDDYLGWAPLPPAPGLGVSVEIGSVPDYYWQIVPAQSFLSVDLSVAIIHDQEHFHPLFAQTRPLGNVTIVNNVVVNKVVNVNYVEEKTHRKVVTEKVAAAGVTDPTGKNALGKIGKFTPPAGGGGPPHKLKKLDEVALTSQTKGQAGNQPAMELATLSKLKGPALGKKTKADEPPPPPPGSFTGASKTLNAVKVGGQTCPAGEQLHGDKCVPVQCPQGEQLRGDKCVSIQCPQGEQLRGDKCVPIQCPQGEQLRGDKCVPIQCPAGQHPQGNGCVPNGLQCPAGQHPQGNGCVPNGPQCPAGQHPQGNGCVPNGPQCPAGQHPEGNACVPNGLQCPAGQHPQGNGCVPNGPQCPAGQHPQGNGCVPNGPQCPAGEHPQGNGCVPNGPQCPAGQQLGKDNKCHRVG
jgi:uncharacterized protein YraI